MTSNRMNIRSESPTEWDGSKPAKTPATSEAYRPLSTIRKTRSKASKGVAPKAVQGKPRGKR